MNAEKMCCFSFSVDYFVMLVLNLIMSFTGLVAFQNNPTASFNETQAVITIVFGFVLLLIGPVLALFCWFFPLYYAYRQVYVLSVSSYIILFSIGRIAPLHSCGSSSFSQHNAYFGSSMLLVLEDSPGEWVCSSPYKVLGCFSGSTVLTNK